MRAVIIIRLYISLGLRKAKLQPLVSGCVVRQKTSIQLCRCRDGDFPLLRLEGGGVTLFMFTTQAFAFRTICGFNSMVFWV